MTNINLHNIAATVNTVVEDGVLLEVFGDNKIELTNNGTHVTTILFEQQNDTLVIDVLSGRGRCRWTLTQNEDDVRYNANNFDTKIWSFNEQEQVMELADVTLMTSPDDCFVWELQNYSGELDGDWLAEFVGDVVVNMCLI